MRLKQRTLYLIIFLIFAALFYKYSHTSSILKFDFRDKQLENLVQRDLEGQKGEFAVVVEPLISGESYRFNDQAVFPAASLYKLILISAAYKAIEDNQLKMDDMMIASKDYLIKRLGEVDFGYEDVSGDVRYSVEEALIRISEISDNFAAIMLTDKLHQVTHSKKNNDVFEQITKEYNLSQTVFAPETITTTASDIAALFKQFYAGQVVTRSASDDILELLARSRLKDRIPAKLPESVKVAHKTGELSRVRHDVGIVYLEGRPYIIVLMSKDLEYEDEGVAVIANISKDVYDFFSKQVTPAR